MTWRRYITSKPPRHGQRILIFTAPIHSSSILREYPIGMSELIYDACGCDEHITLWQPFPKCLELPRKYR